MGLAGHTETLAHAQKQESPEDVIAPNPVEIESTHDDLAGASDADDAWQSFNLLSLDGGGIRGYWTLLALERLFIFIGKEEENYHVYDSFHPEDYPNNVWQAPLTGEEDRAMQETYNHKVKHQSSPRSRRYLPCHYFDHICGSSTGALIAIMLGRFRMTIPDGLYEYQRLGQEVFGKPRIISTLRFGLGERHKYKAARLEKIFQDVSISRNEQPEPKETSKILFPSGRGLCATFVTTLEREEDGRSSELKLLRSYDHEKSDSPDQSKGVTPRSTMRSDRVNTDTTTNTNITEKRHTRKRSLVQGNYGKASQLEVWQVARAATAAKFYFEPLRLTKARVNRGFTEYTDGGFGSSNNPTQKGKQEIEELHGFESIGIVVSVGTARKLKKDAKKATFFSTIPDTAREFADQMTDPEEIHTRMQRDYKKHKDFSYYRLNFPGGLQTELDEWEPKSKIYNQKEGGMKTIKDIKSAFHAWAQEPDTIEQLQECANALVKCRRGRMNTSKWERYATGSRYACPVRGCDPGDFFDRRLFERHLKNQTLKNHGFEGDDLEDALSRCRKHWRYQAARK